MRFWLAVLVLFGGFAACVLWQTHWTRGLRTERDRAWAGSALAEVEAATPAELPFERRPPAPRRDQRDSGPWARVVVGRPSGAEPVAPPPRPSVAHAASGGGAASGAGGAPLEPDFTTTVRPGQSLSVICQEHYGSARAELVRALATYNGLADPDRIQVGGRIVLPPEQHLVE
jgi:nucleoid-associated protein YgaU